MQIRVAVPEDAPAIREIYFPYVVDTAISFEYEVPSIEEFRNRIRNTLKDYPYLVAVEDGTIVGYAYAGPLYARKAYQHAAELSVYVKWDRRGQGIGRCLYQELEKILIHQNVYTVHACIASPDRENKDEHLIDDSEKFHKKMGFETAGRHEKCGYKFGKWYSVVWMDKVICERPAEPEDFVPFHSIATYCQGSCMRESAE